MHLSLGGFQEVVYITDSKSIELQGSLYNYACMSD